MKNDNSKFKNDLKKRIYVWTLKLVRFIDDAPKGRSVDVMANQLIRSGTSIGANYIEAQAASSKKDFTNFFHYALKSANESKFWLALLRDTQKVDKEEVKALLDELVEICNILGSSILTLKGKKK